MRQCPECEAEKVTLTPEEGSILGHPIEHFVFAAEDGETLGVVESCWECGWTEHKTVHVEVNS